MLVPANCFEAKEEFYNTCRDSAKMTFQMYLKM